MILQPQKVLMQMFYKSARVEYHPVGVVSNTALLLGALHCCHMHFPNNSQRFVI